MKKDRLLHKQMGFLAADCLSCDDKLQLSCETIFQPFLGPKCGSAGRCEARDTFECVQKF